MTKEKLSMEEPPGNEYVLSLIGYCVKENKNKKTITIPPEAARLECKMCGEEKPLTI